MRKNFFRQLISSLAFLSLCFCVFGQNEDETPSTEDLMAVFSMQFDIAAPDTSFTQTEQGWAEASTQSQVACSALPASFERVMQDFNDFTLPEGMRMVSKDSLTIEGVIGFLVVTEATPPAEEPNQEHFYTLMYLRPWDKKITLNINAAYPKSQHDRLYQKILATFATVRKKEN